jgi:hypothetical protein
MTAGVLDFGGCAIRVTFDTEALARRAFDRLYLSPGPSASVVGDIRYVRDDSVADLVRQEGPANAVLIDRAIEDPQRFVLNLKVFNEFTVSLRRERDRLFVRYPANAPLTYLLDDVLQAAIQPFLEESGGFILHGSCLVKNGVALALMGNSGAGKSTTAFSLMRAGYHCYADDAVVVTREGERLRAWPFSREISVRPLSFQLLRTQGLSFSGYRREGRKYYFKQSDVPDSKGALLRHACLIEVGGERGTRVQPLTREIFLERLRGDQRYFSFVNRDHHARYAEVVARLVPDAASVQLGSDLQEQTRAFDSLLDPRLPPPAADFNPGVNGRSAKLEILRRAWSRPGAEPLAELIPLLADSDLTIFKNALSFFQNFPLARLEPGLEPALPEISSSAGFIDADADSIDWLRLREWESGCLRLIELSCPEAYDQYASGWFRSAPMLYAILRLLTDSKSPVYRSLGEAWSRGPGSTSAESALPVVILSHGARNRGDTDDLRGEPAPGRMSPTHLVYDDTRGWSAAFVRLASTGAHCGFVLVPVFAGPDPDLASTMRCLRVARSLGLRPKLARCVPLCWLSQEQATELLAYDAFLAPREAPRAAAILHLLNAPSPASQDGRFSWKRPACHGRSACRLHDLGLCAEGYFGQFLRGDARPAVA